MGRPPGRSPGPLLLEVIAPAVLGAAEVAALLGVSRQRVHELRRQGRLPQPAELSCGPVWDRREIEQFVASWYRRPGRKGPESRD